MKNAKTLLASDIELVLRLDEENPVPEGKKLTGYYYKLHNTRLLIKLEGNSVVVWSRKLVTNGQDKKVWAKYKPGDTDSITLIWEKNHLIVERWLRFSREAFQCFWLFANRLEPKSSQELTAPILHIPAFNYFENLEPTSQG